MLSLQVLVLLGLVRVTAAADANVRGAEAEVLPGFHALSYHGGIQEPPADLAAFQMVCDFHTDSTVSFWFFEEDDVQNRVECPWEPFTFAEGDLRLGGSNDGQNCVAAGLEHHYSLVLQGTTYDERSDSFDLALTTPTGETLHLVLKLGIPDLAGEDEEPSDELERLVFDVRAFHGRIGKASGDYAKLMFVAEFHREEVVDVWGFSDDDEDDITDCPGEPYVFEDGELSLLSADDAGSCVATALEVAGLTLVDIRFQEGVNRFTVTFTGPESEELVATLSPGVPF